MLLISTSLKLPSLHSIKEVTTTWSPVLNRICKIGISAAKEKIFSNADNKLKIIDNATYFL